MNKQALIDWNGRHFYCGYSDRVELAALRKLLKASESFEDAKFVHEATLNSLLEYSRCFEVANGALKLAVAKAKGFDDYLYVLIHSVYGTTTYMKALKGAEKTAKTQQDLQTSAEINIRKEKKYANNRNCKSSCRN